MYKLNVWKNFKKTSKVDSKLENIQIKYLYFPQGCEHPEELKGLLVSLQNKFSGTRTVPIMGAGADGFVEFSLTLKLNLSIIVAPFIAKFLDGLLNGDGLKQVGENYRKIFLRWFSKTEAEIMEIITEIENLLEAYPNVLVRKGSNTSIPIVIEVKQDRIKIKILIEYKPDLPKKAIEILPLSISNAVCFFARNETKADTNEINMEFDFDSNKWILKSITITEIPEIHLMLSDVQL
jgi:hypothetical protein